MQGPSVMCVAGARPNFMKVGPVMAALSRRGASVTLIHTGQHYDANMSDVFLKELDLPAPDYWLEVGSGSHAQQTAAVMIRLEPLVLDIKPDILVVVGDVNSTMAAALVGAKLGVQVAHVEAGLRSGDWSMPEEINRVVTDRVSDYLFAPSPDAAVNLRREGIAEQRIHVVGNVMIDTLLSNLDKIETESVLSKLGLEAGNYGLVTLHRPANVDDPAVLSALVNALGEVADLCPLVLPAHPRTRDRLNGLAVNERLRIIEPVGYLAFLALEAGARIVLTDSGGIQEETTVLGVACLTLRENTERPITVTDGTNTVVGRDPERIVAEAKRVLSGPITARRPALWDGKAGDRIARVLTQSL